MKWIIILAFAVTAAAQERVFVFASEAKFEFEGKLVTGAPYSAQAVTETTQILADGNRITRKSSSLIARDSQGRTRREQNLGTVGPWASPESKGVIFINDPVANARYTLEPGAKTAVKIIPNGGGLQERRELEMKLKQAARAKEEAERSSMGAKRTEILTDSLGLGKKNGEPKNNATTESLGTRTIEGVVAEGKRMIETIPAGTIGNEKPIDIVNEAWYSSELQTIIMSRHSDPRSGDVVYTLTNISRAEPDPSMFTVPQDYKVKEEQVFERRK
jgi:hypothetical protein